MSTSRSVVHHLSPSVDGAYCDMKAVIKSGDELVRCYFADNDLIAAGAMRALSEAGYRIPEDISVIALMICQCVPTLHHLFRLCMCLSSTWVKLQ